MEGMTDKQDWLNPKIEIKDSPVEGKGIFALEDIPEGEKVVVFGGKYVTRREVENCRKQGKLVMQWDEDLYSCEDRGDEDGYFINHSCDPNIWLLDAYTLVARRDIKKGEELTADYAMWEADEDYVSQWECKCDSPFCRGRVTGKDWQEPDLQQRYKGHFSPLINKRIRMANGK